MKRLVMLLAAGVAVSSAADLLWYMQETAMTAEGRLTFLEKPWWPRAKALAEGESFLLDLNKDGRPDTMVVRKGGHIIEAIDDSGHATNIWNQISTAYVVSYKGTGIVDRMVVYLDNDGDGRADEMEMRNYQDGYLRYSWFGENYDGDGIPIFDLKDWHYAGNNGNNKFRGNLEIYLNKYDARTGNWSPLSECPFAFWDDNKDGHGDIVLRVSAVPLASLQGSDTDYANNYSYMWAPEATPLEEIGNLNVRFSFNIDAARREPLDKPHYNFGFTMLGVERYNYPDMTYTNPKRRPPQTVTRISWKDGVRVGMTYPARKTAFSWDESRSVWRWEGQFWIFDRIYIQNTGGPTHRWNMRREFSPAASSARQLYYSEADRRYHLQGVSEGWLEAGHLVNDRKDLEFRWFDRDGDGRLDETQVFEAEKPAPVRVSRFDPRARPVTLDRNSLIEEYNRRVLPEAIRENREFIAALKKVWSSETAALYEAEAAKAEAPERQRYCLDIARELHYLKVRETLWARLASSPYSSGAPQARARYMTRQPGSAESGYTLGDTIRYWDKARLMAQFEQQYGAGELSSARRILERLE